MSNSLPPTRPGAKVDAVVLAGSINRIRLYPGAEPGYKALVPMHDRPLIAYVLDALRAAKRVGRIIVVGPTVVRDYAARWPGVEGAPECETLVRNAYCGLQTARTERVFFCHPDQPLLRVEMVDDFLERALPVEADLVSSWVRVESLGRYVEGRHKFADFGDGCFAHGNLFLARRDFPDVERVRSRLDRIYHARKSNLRFAWALGPALFVRFAWAMLTGKLPNLSETLRVAGEHFGLTLAAVVSPHPEIALDIDEPEDYAAAEKYLGSGNAAITT